VSLTLDEVVNGMQTTIEHAFRRLCINIAPGIR